jgi:hypothetical protein
VQDALGVGEEGVTSLPDEQAAGAGLHGLGRRIEGHRRIPDDHVTTGFAGLGAAACGIGGGGGLPTVSRRGERKTERDVGQRIPVVVNVEPVDRVWVEPVALRERVGAHDHDRPVGVIGPREHEQVGEVQTSIAAGALEGGSAEVVGHGAPFRPENFTSELFTSSAWVRRMA